MWRSPVQRGDRVVHAKDGKVKRRPADSILEVAVGTCHDEHLDCLEESCRPRIVTQRNPRRSKGLGGYRFGRQRAVDTSRPIRRRRLARRTAAKDPPHSDGPIGHASRVLIDIDKSGYFHRTSPWYVAWPTFTVAR